jgi:endogenous inhibitor of DNA gyrase (YacG/DUF329 family)
MSAIRYVSCPRCGAQVPWTAASAYRPFCSERCKTVDLGAWAAEEYRVAPAEPNDEQSLQTPQNPHTSPPPGEPPQ